MAAWRRHLHAHPEIGFAEVRTAAFVADSAPLHGSRYDFDDVILPVGAAMWSRLVERLCPA